MVFVDIYLTSKQQKFIYVDNSIHIPIHHLFMWMYHVSSKKHYEAKQENVTYLKNFPLASAVSSVQAQYTAI